MPTIFTVCTRCSIVEPSFCLLYGSTADLGFTVAAWWAGCQVLAKPVAGGHPDDPQSRHGGEAAPLHGLQMTRLAETCGSTDAWCTVYGTPADTEVKINVRSRLESSNTTQTLHVILRSIVLCSYSRIYFT